MVLTLYAYNNIAILSYCQLSGWRALQTLHGSQWYRTYQRTGTLNSAFTVCFSVIPYQRTGTLNPTFTACCWDWPFLFLSLGPFSCQYHFELKCVAVALECLGEAVTHTSRLYLELSLSLLLLLSHWDYHSSVWRRCVVLESETLLKSCSLSLST